MELHSHLNASDANSAVTTSYLHFDICYFV